MSAKHMKHSSLFATLKEIGYSTLKTP